MKKVLKILQTMKILFIEYVYDVEYHEDDVLFLNKKVFRGLSHEIVRVKGT
jgi:hypothetical protein